MGKTIGLILLAYLMGSFPTTFLAARLLKGVDLRKVGSGNVGGSNLWAQGTRWAVLPAVGIDVLKGAAPVLLAQTLGMEHWPQVAIGLATVAGHNWSLYLRFSGGRGLGTSAGVLLALAWKELLALAGVALLGIAIFRSSALWLGIAILLLPFWSLILREPVPITGLCLGLLALTLTKRLLSNPGTAKPGTRWRDVWLYRLMYDRDTRSRDRWVHRKPTECEESS